MLPTRRHAALLAALGSAAAFAPLPATARTGLKDGAFTGDTFSAYYGYVQVRALVRNGSLDKVEVLKHPSDRLTSRFISSRALPVLEREAVRSQGRQVDLVSGATLTSRAFARSLETAMAKAR